MTWDAIAALALALPGTELSTSYGKPAVKANGRTIVSVGGDDGFVLHIDQDTKAMLIETDPAIFWQTPHYDGWPAVLVRYAGDDPDRVAAMIERAYDQALAKKPPRQRP